MPRTASCLTPHCSLWIDTRVRPPGCQSTLVFAHAVLGGADFLPTRDFGLLTAIGVVMAFVADLFLFPILLGRRAAVAEAPADQPVTP